MRGKEGQSWAEGGGGLDESGKWKGIESQGAGEGKAILATRFQSLTDAFAKSIGNTFLMQT